MGALKPLGWASLAAVLVWLIGPLQIHTGYMVWSLQVPLLLLTLTNACVFVAAILAAERSAGAAYCPAWRYFIGVLLATSVCVALRGVTWDWLGRPAAFYPTKETRDYMAAKKSDASAQRVMVMVATGGTFFIYGLLGTFIYVRVRNLKMAARRLADEELERADAERRLDDAKLRSLESKLDPVFVFSRLEEIERMSVARPAEAISLLDDLSEKLRATIAKVRLEVT